MATGGTLARRIIVDRRPRLIIAVACEAGPEQRHPGQLPAAGLWGPHSRPQAPCFDTLVDLDKVGRGLKVLSLAPRSQRTPDATAIN